MSDFKFTMSSGKVVPFTSPANNSQDIWQNAGYKNLADAVIKGGAVRDPLTDQWTLKSSITNTSTANIGAGADLGNLKNIVNQSAGTNAAFTGQTNAPLTQQPQQQPIQQMPSFTPTNNMGAINAGYDAALQSTIASIKAAVQQQKQAQQDIINKAPEQYGNLKNVVYNQALAGLPAMNERIANLGASTEGGYSRTEQARAESDLQNRLAELDRQKQDVVDQANQEIARLEAAGQTDEANATRELALEKLQAIVAESSRLDELNYNISKDTTANAIANRQLAMQEAGLTGKLGNEQTIAGKESEANIAGIQASTEYQRLVNAGYNTKQAADLAQAAETLRGTELANDYQNLVNSSYPEEQKTKMAQALATLTGTNYANDYQALVNAGYPAQQAADLAQKAATLKSTNIANDIAEIDKKFEAQIKQGQIDSQALDIAYKTMVNANLPKEQAANIAQILATTAGIKLDNDAKAIANMYAKEIAQGQIDGQKLQNAYQKLINAGYNKSQAADIAYKYASANALNTKASNTAAGTLTPSQMNSATKPYIDYINKTYYTGSNSAGNPAMTMQNKRDTANYIAGLYKQGVDKDVVDSLFTKYNIDEKFIKENVTVR